LQFAKDDQTQAIQISTTLILLGKQSISVQPQTMTHGSGYPMIQIGIGEPSIRLSPKNQSHKPVCPLPGHPLEWVSGTNTYDLQTTPKQNLKI